LLAAGAPEYKILRVELAACRRLIQQPCVRLEEIKAVHNMGMSNTSAERVVKAAAARLGIPQTAGTGETQTLRAVPDLADRVAAGEVEEILPCLLAFLWLVRVAAVGRE